MLLEYFFSSSSMLYWGLGDLFFLSGGEEASCCGERGWVSKEVLRKGKSRVFATEEERR
jgi:hypothetical protein